MFVKFSNKMSSSKPERSNMKWTKEEYEQLIKELSCHFICSIATIHQRSIPSIRKRKQYLMEKLENEGKTDAELEN